MNQGMDFKNVADIHLNSAIRAQVRDFKSIDINIIPACRSQDIQEWNSRDAKREK